MPASKKQIDNKNIEKAILNLYSSVGELTHGEYRKDIIEIKNSRNLYESYNIIKYRQYVPIMVDIAEYNLNGQLPIMIAYGKWIGASDGYFNT